MVPSLADAPFHSVWAGLRPGSSDGLPLLGPAPDWENVVIACVPCNQRKGGRTPAQAKMLLRTQPIRPTKLPDTMRIVIGWEKGMPTTWRNWLRDYSYWNGELDHDE